MKDRGSVNSIEDVTPKRPGKKVLRISQIFPPSDWPLGMSQDQVDTLSVDQYESIKARLLKAEKLKQTETPLPGMVIRKTTAVIPKSNVKGGMDDAMTVFTDGRWQKFPVSDPVDWWQQFGHQVA